jgi:hypothetical protein
LLVGSRAPLTYEADAIRTRIAEEPYKSALSSAWRAIDLEGFFAHYVARSSMAEALAAAEHGRLNTDDRTLVEFGFARMAADNDALSSKDRASPGALEHRPAVFGVRSTGAASTKSGELPRRRRRRGGPA